MDLPERSDERKSPACLVMPYAFNLFYFLHSTSHDLNVLYLIFFLTRLLSVLF